MKFICPYCYKRHEEKDLIYLCQNKKDCPFAVTRGDRGRIDYKAVSTCRKKCDQLYLAFCPENTDKRVPSHAMNQSVSVAMLGGRNSGKSHYIAVLVNEIKQTMSLRYRCSLMACDDATDTRYINHFYNPLFHDHTPLRSTDAGRQDPLLFNIDFTKKGPFGNRIESLLLPLYDTAGENFSSAQDLVENVNYVRVAGGMILLLDPFEIDELAEKLFAHGITNNGIKPEKLENILRRIQELLQRGKINKILDVPIAIVLTKLDLLLDSTELIPEDSVLRAPSAHLDASAYSLREHAAVDSAVRELLSGSTNINNLIQRLDIFKTTAFFAVSSLGCDPGTSDLKTNMKPYRVLDPLLWLLSQHGYVKTVK